MGHRPLATVVIGGVLSANMLTLVVLPAIQQDVRRARRWKEPDNTHRNGS